MAAAAGQHDPQKVGKEPENRDASGANASPVVSAVELPAGAIRREQANAREKRFLERVERRVANIDRIFHPPDKKFYSFRGARREFSDPYTLVAETLRRLGIFEPALLDQLPHNRVLRYSVGGGGWLRKKKPKVVLCAAVQSPVEDLARFGGTVTPLGRGAVQAVVEQYVKDSDTYYLIGVLSTVGWEDSLWETPPRGDNYAVLLIEETASGAWRVEHSLVPELAPIAAVFDPEDHDEKTARVYYWVTNHVELRIPGGHTDVERALEELRVDRATFDKALAQIAQEDSALKVETVGGREILKRDRY
ncbi:MAG: hypothetical protein AAF581_16175 [Planctomycetota bacterium]